MDGWSEELMVGRMQTGQEFLSFRLDFGTVNLLRRYRIIEIRGKISIEEFQ